MLFNPSVLLSHPLALIATLLIVVVAKSGIAYLVMRLFRQSQSTSLMLGASRAQIGEFSFILVGLGVTLGVLPALGRDLILAAALISIMVTPFLFVAADWIYAHHEPVPKKAEAPAPEAASTPPAADPAETEVPTRAAVPVTKLTGHTVLIGYGRVGSVVGAELKAAGVPLLVFESDDDLVEGLHKQGIETVHGNAADPQLARAANYPAARCVLVAVPDGFEGGQIVEQAHAINPKLPIIARSHSDEETEHLKRHGATKVIMGEHLIAHAMIADAREAGAAAAQAPAPPSPTLDGEILPPHPAGAA
jgi:CPA2 family monovalent cation:H+ antiporter-2